jgi:hypothetical protein
MIIAESDSFIRHIPYYPCLGWVDIAGCNYSRERLSIYTWHPSFCISLLFMGEGKVN